MKLENFNKVIDTDSRRWDIFKTSLGILFLFVAGYLWINYFLEFGTPSFNLMSKLGLYILFIVVLMLVILGFHLFITGIFEMENVYDIERALIQIKYIKSLQELYSMNLQEFDLNKKTKNKFKKYIKQKIQEAFKYFE